jgi:thioredoxin reductase
MRRAYSGSTAAADDTTAIDKAHVIVHTADGGRHHFHMVYSVLGTVGRSELGRQLGCETGPDGRFVAVNNKRETDVLGVYAAGDVVDGLNQVRACGAARVCRGERSGVSQLTRRL